MKITKYMILLLLLVSVPVHGYAQWGKHGNVQILPAQDLPKNLLNVGAARDIQYALSLIPHGETLDWTIVISDHDAFQSDYRKKMERQGEGVQHYPQRCWTYIEKRETHCDIYFATEFSGMAKAGTLAHEYGHILCGTGEDDADRCGAELMHGVAPNTIKVR
jgi:hypothetical protein